MFPTFFFTDAFCLDRLTLNCLMASLCKFSDGNVVSGEVMLSLEWCSKGLRQRLDPIPKTIFKPCL